MFNLLLNIFKVIQKKEKFSLIKRYLDIAYVDITYEIKKTKKLQLI